MDIKKLISLSLITILVTATVFVKSEYMSVSTIEEPLTGEYRKTAQSLLSDEISEGQKQMKQQVVKKADLKTDNDLQKNMLRELVDERKALVEKQKDIIQRAKQLKKGKELLSSEVGNTIKQSQENLDALKKHDERTRDAISMPDNKEEGWALLASAKGYKLKPIEHYKNDAKAFEAHQKHETALQELQKTISFELDPATTPEKVNDALEKARNLSKEIKEHQEILENSKPIKARKHLSESDDDIYKLLEPKKQKPEHTDKSLQEALEVMNRVATQKALENEGKLMLEDGTVVESGTTEGSGLTPRGTHFRRGIPENLTEIKK